MSASRERGVELFLFKHNNRMCQESGSGPAMTHVWVQLLPMRTDKGGKQTKIAIPGCSHMNRFSGRSPGVGFTPFLFTNKRPISQHLCQILLENVLLAEAYYNVDKFAAGSGPNKREDARAYHKKSTCAKKGLAYPGQSSVVRTYTPGSENIATAQ